jgi:tetratricopeptide (TPR) repeat protein
MGGSIRVLRVTLTTLVAVAGVGLVRPPVGSADDKPQPQAKAADRKDAAVAGPAKPSAPGPAPARLSGRLSELSEYFSQPGDDPPRAFVPLRPATVDDRRRIEAVRLYSAARALEDLRRWTDAVSLLQEASKLDPDSVAIPRRLSKIYIGAMGRPDLAIEYGRKVLALEPGDSETLARLFDFFMQLDPEKSDSPGAEALLKEVLANPRLDAHAPGRLLAEFELGKLYYTRLRQFEKAADAYAKVMDGLDDKSANRLTPAELTRILGNEPALAYLNFGLVFITSRRDALAARALERAMVYDEDNPQIAMVLAETLLRLHKADQALTLVERLIKRQPQGAESYELLAKVLTSLGREKEITPRLEEAVQHDSKNVPLQYILADHYRETGQVEKADALYKELLTESPTPQTYRALTTSLLKRKKAGDLLKVICEAVARNMQEAVLPQLKAAAADDSLSEAMLDAGYAQLSANPPTLPQTAYTVLTFIANPDRAGNNKPRRLEKLMKLHRLLLQQAPTAQAFAEIAFTQRRMGQFAEAANTLERMLAKYPNQKSVGTLASLAGDQRRAGRLDAAAATVAEALKLPATDPESQYLLAGVLADINRADDAIRILRELAAKEPNNPLYEMDLADKLSRFGRNDEAIKIFEGLLKRFGDNDEIVSQVRSRLSVTYVNMGNYAKGEAELEMLLQRDPDEAGPNNDLGYLYAEQGKNLAKAESMVRKALQEDPENYAYLDSIGWVLFKQGKIKEALESLTKAEERMKAFMERLGLGFDPTIFEHLGDVYFKLHEMEKAEASWSKAIKACEEAVPPSKRAGEIKKKIESLRKLSPSIKPSSNQSP